MGSPEVKFTAADKMTVAYLEMRGDYSRIGDEMKRLKTWIDSKGIEQTSYPFCLFYDDPTSTPEQDLRSEACIPVVAPFEPEGDYKLKVMEGVQVAETRHGGPAEDFPETYGPFLEGLLKDGYQAVGPPREYFMSVSDVKGPGSGFLIQQPVTKK